MSTHEATFKVINIQVFKWQINYLWENYTRHGRFYLFWQCLFHHELFKILQATDEQIALHLDCRMCWKHIHRATGLPGSFTECTSPFTHLNLNKLFLKPMNIRHYSWLKQNKAEMKMHINKWQVMYTLK